MYGQHHGDTSVSGNTAGGCPKTEPEHLPSIGPTVIDGEEDEDSGTEEPTPWLSLWLRWYMLTASVGVTLAIQGIVIGLTIHSTKNDGIASVNSKGGVLVVFVDFGIGLLWTALPALFFQVYAIILAIIVRAASARQPFVELMRQSDEGAAAEKSIFLDYDDWVQLRAIYNAVRYGHLMIAYGIFVSLVVQIFITPISAHLFDTLTTSIPSTTTISQPFEFDLGVDGFGPRSDLSPTLDIVAATQIYGGLPVAWTTDNASLRPFDLTAIKAQPGPVNVSAETNSQSLLMDCVALTNSEYTLEREDNGGWYFSADYGGCTYPRVQFTGELSGTIVFFAETYRAQCVASAKSSRIIVVLALNEDFSSTDFSTKTVVSCAPSYYSQTGLANLFANEMTTALISYHVHDVEIAYVVPVFAPNFEEQLNQPLFIDTTSLRQANKLGGLILDSARQHGGVEFMDSDVVINATQKIITSAFSIMVQRFLVKRTAGDRIEAAVYREQTRVRVVPPVAFSILGVLTLVVIGIIWIGFYTYRHIEGQYEEAKALVGAAAVLCNSTLMSEVASKKTRIRDGKVAEKFTKIQGRERWGWKIERWGDPTKSAIVKTDGARPIKWFQA